MHGKASPITKTEQTFNSRVKYDFLFFSILILAF